MIIKKGNFVRDVYNNIGIVMRVDEGGGIFFDNATSHMLRFPQNGEIIEVAETPQELVQKDDLIELKANYKGLTQVMDIQNVKILIGVDKGKYVKQITYGNSVSFLSSILSDITKILTPNKEDGYDKQWEVANEKTPKS
jgi:hypothetical protein